MPNSKIEDFILVRILSVKDWAPLSRTKKLDELREVLVAGGLDIYLFNIQKEFAHWIADLLKFRVREAINKQNFPVKYKPLSPAYVAKKKKEGGKSGFWRNTEFLVHNIKVWESPSAVFNVGFPKHLKHKSSNEFLVDIARSLEFGVKERNLPARPLFTPYARIISKSIIRYFVIFLKSYHRELIDFMQKEGIQI